MRHKDHKRFILGSQKLIRKAAARGVIDLTAGIYQANFGIDDPKVKKVRSQHYLKLLGQIELAAISRGDPELKDEISVFIASLYKGGVKGIK